MAPAEIGEQAVMTRAALDHLVAALIADGYQVIGPTVRDGAIVLAELGSADALPAGWGVDTGPGYYRLRPREDAAVFAHSAGPGSWKEFLHPPRRPLWTADAGGFRAAEPETPRYAFLGVRGCDLAAIGILGRVLGEGAHPDGAFARTRQNLFVVAVNCTEPGGVCFCASMGTGPAAGPGYDLALTERLDESGHWFLAEAGHARGRPHSRRDPPPRRVPGGAGRGAGRRERGGAADGPGDARGGPARADPRVGAVTPLGGRGQPVPDLRQLHHGLPHVLLHHDRGRGRPDR